MRARTVFLGTGLILVLGAAAALNGQQPAQAPAAPAAPAGPTILLAPGLREVPDYRKNVGDPPAPAIPDGYTSIFNGKDLTEWHVSTTARHGVQPDFHVAHGMILGTQRPFGSGGLLLTDKKYRNFDLTMEVKPDWGCDSGLFFRTTEMGAAYQITLDYLPGGSMGSLIGEGGIAVTTGARGAGGGGRAAGAPAGGGRAAGATPAAAAPAAPAASAAPPTAAAQLAARAQSNNAGMRAWKHEDWNVVRVRVEGDAPHATIWINGAQITDATDSENHAVDKMVSGPIAIQIHGGNVRWQPGGFWRWRNIGIRELK